MKQKKLFDSKTYRDIKKEGSSEYIKSIINFDGFGVACFSTNDNNLLMWSHYSNQHEGLCIKYDVLDDIFLFYKLKKVKYQEEYPDFQFFRDAHKYEKIEELLTTKFIKWEYKEELRLVHNYGGKFPLEKTCIKEIIFGCKTSETDINKVIKLFNDNKYKVKFKKKKIHSQRFELEDEDIDITKYISS